MWELLESRGVDQSQVDKKSFDLSWLITDSHLSKSERDIIVDSYQKDKERLFQATKNELKSFILRDYGAANMQSLGGFDGVVALQKALKVDPADGSFGPDTFKALIEYQKNNNLTIDGIAGTETMWKLGITKDSKIKAESLGKIDKRSWNGSLKRGSEKSTEAVSIGPPISMAPVIKKFTTFTNWVEEQIKSTNDHKKENTGIVAGVGDWIWEKTGAFETGKSIYEQQIKQAQDRAKELHSQIITQFQWKNIPETERIEVEKLITRLEKLAWAKLEEVSWWKAVFNTIGAGDIEWDTGSLKNRTKIFAKTTIGFAEGAYDVVSSIAEITGKAIGITAAYVGSSVSEGKFDSSVGKQITSDVREIFSILTIENAKIAIAKLPEALEKFANASPDVQAEGFGKFFGSLLVAGWVWVKVFQWGKHAVQLWNRAIRMANHKWLSKSVPLALAWAVQLWSGTAAIGTGVALRVGEMDVIPVKKWVKKSSKNIELEAKKSGEISHGSADKSVGWEQKSWNAEWINDTWKPLLKSFEVDWVDSKKLYKRMAMYYHPDRNVHPQAKEIFQEMKDAFERWDRKKLEAIAKDPDGFLKSKNPSEHIQMTPHEKFMDGLKKYQDQFSESYLRWLAQKDAHAFGEALLHKHTLEEFATLAKTDPDRAIAEFNSFMKNPNEYFAKKFPSPYITVDSEIRNYYRQAYEGKYKAEWERLTAINRQAYEEYLRNNPTVKGNIEQIMAGLEEVGKILDGKFTTLAKQIKEITDLLKGDIREKWGLVNSKLESFIEWIRLEPNIGLKMKADISQRIRSLREKYFSKTKNEISDWIQEKTPQFHKTMEENIEQFMSKTKSTLTADILKNNPELKPVRTLEIDGQKFAFSWVFNDGKYDLCFGYVERNWIIESRLFYKSHSDGGWRSAPVLEGKRFSKGENIVENSSYTTTTKPDYRIDNFLNSVPQVDSTVSIGKYFSIINEDGSLNFLPYSDQMRQDVHMFDDGWLLQNLDRLTQDVGGGFSKGNQLAQSELRRKFQSVKYPSWFIPDFFHSTPVATYKFEHTLVWDTYVAVYEGVLNGQKVEWHMAQSLHDPDMVWISNIRPSWGRISSFGTDVNPINSGILTSKPYEYANLDHQQWAYGNYARHPQEWKYVNTTEDLAFLRPIAEYKEYLNSFKKKQA